MGKTQKDKPVFRVRNGETDAQIAAEIVKSAEAGVIVCYFNDQATFDQWCRRVAALA